MIFQKLALIAHDHKKVDLVEHKKLWVKPYGMQC